MLIILAMVWLHNLKDQENKPLWLHLVEDFSFSFPKFSALLKNANFLLLLLLGPESLLSFYEQCLFNGVEIKPSVENTAQGVGTIYILKIGLKWDVGCAQTVGSSAQR